MKRNVLSVIFSVVLALFLAITLFAGTLCVYGYTTVCNRTLLADAITDSGFGRELYDEILYKWENLLAITGVMEPESILQVLTPEGVEADAKAYFMGAYEGSSDLDTNALSAALEEKIRSYAYSHNIQATPEAELEKNIADLVSACMKEYRQSVQIRLIPKLLSAVASKERLLKIGAMAAAGASVLFAVFLFFLQAKRRDTLYYSGVSTATGAVIILGLCWLVSYNQVLARLPFEASALKTLLVYYLEKLLAIFRQLGLLFLLVTAALLLAYVLILVIGHIRAKRAQPKTE